MVARCQGNDLITPPVEIDSRVVDSEKCETEGQFAVMSCLCFLYFLMCLTLKASLQPNSERIFDDTAALPLNPKRIHTSFGALLSYLWARVGLSNRLEPLRLFRTIDDASNAENPFLLHMKAYGESSLQDKTLSYGRNIDAKPEFCQLDRCRDHLFPRSRCRLDKLCVLNHANGGKVFHKLKYYHLRREGSHLRKSLVADHLRFNWGI